MVHPLLKLNKYPPFFQCNNDWRLEKTPFVVYFTAMYFGFNNGGAKTYKTENLQIT